MHRPARETGENERSRRALRGGDERVAVELAGPDPSPAVAAPAQTAALCWAELRRAEWMLYAEGKAHLDPGTYRQQRVDRCHNR